MATQNFINECKNRANANRLGKLALRNLPKEYTQVDYIESSGTQYIDTGVIPTANTKIDLDFEYLGSRDTGWVCLYGERGSQAKTNYALYINGTSLKIATNYADFDGGLTSTVEISKNTKYNAKNDGGSFYLNDEYIANQSTTNEFVTSNKSIYLFEMHQANDTPQGRGMKAKIYQCKFYEGNNLIRNMIPCYRNSDDEVGLYDIVNDVFYTNQGTGSFTYGSVIELEINQSNYLTSIELKDSCCINNEILGSIYTKSADVKVLNLPVSTKLVGKKISPEIGVIYSDDSTEYVTFDDYTIESVNDEQTASNTSFTAMNGGTLLDKEYECSLSFDNGTTHTIKDFYEDACEQIGLTPTDSTFDNDDIELTGNPFTNKETIRTVFSEVEKTSCSIMKFDWTNMTVTLTWLSNQIDYEFNTNDYSTLEGSLAKYGPVNVVIIANSQLNGENVVMTDTESVAEYGEHQIIIDSPYFLYTETLRRQAIEAIFNKLDGLTYYDLKLITPFGKPFLEIGNKIRINTNENQVYDTYVLSHTFKFDGAFYSTIESPALTQEEQTIKNEFKNNSIKERVQRTELIVDKTTGDIEAINQKVTTVEDNLGNIYTKEQVNDLIQNAETGLTNTFTTNGGNNILKNTGLWFEDKSERKYLYPDNNLYPSNDLYLLAQPYYEYWQGFVIRGKEDKAVNSNCLILQDTTLKQEQQVKNEKYTLSFKYRLLIPTATVKAIINGKEIDLTEIDDTEIVETFEVNSQYIDLEFESDRNDSCEIYDLMINIGEEKAPYSQNQNESQNNTVNISKGITITSSDTNTTFKADSDGIRVYNSRNMQTPITDFTDTGTKTKKIIVENEAQIVDLYIQKVNTNTWITKL